MVDDLDRCSQQVKERITGLINSLHSSKFMGETPLIYIIVTMSVSGPDTTPPVPIHLGADHEYLAPFTREDITQYIRLALVYENPKQRQIPNPRQAS